MFAAMPAAPRALAQAAAPAFETPGPRPAADCLPEVWLQASHHRVLPDVDSDGTNLFYGIESDFGFYRVQGTDWAQERIREIGAIAKLQEVRKSDVFVDALKSAGESKLKTVGRLFQDPGGTLREIPKGAGRSFTRVGESLGAQKSETEDAAYKNFLGVSKAKRSLAADLGIDPYSSNEALQHELDEVGWVAAAGGLTLNVAGAALDGGVGMVVTGINVSDSLRASLVAKTPADLRLENRDRLQGAAVTAALAEAFLDHPQFSPTHETVIAEAIASLGRVKGNDLFFRIANSAWTEEDARFFVRVARVLRGYHAEVARIVELREFDGLVTAVDANGLLIVPVAQDYGLWTERVAGRVETFRRSAAVASGVTGSALWVTGELSSRFVEEMSARSIAVQVKALQHLDSLAEARR